MSDTLAGPTKFSDYLREMRKSGAVLGWVWKELVGREGKRYLKMMLATMVLSTVSSAIQPLIFAHIINHVSDRSPETLAVFVAALLLTAGAQLGFRLLQDIAREWSWNRTIHSMHERINELFYEKTLGQHSGEGTTLNYSTIDRGKARIETLHQMLLFDASGMLVQIAFSYLLIWILGWWVGLVATILVVLHVLWSFHLNYHIAVKTEPIEQDFRSQSRQMHERWEKISRVKTSGKTSSEHERLFAWFDDILERDIQFWSWLIRRAKVRDGVVILVRVLAIAYGVYLVYKGEWQVGALVPLYSWMTDLTQNLWWVGNAERRVNQQVPYIRAMRDALMLEPPFIDDEGPSMYSKHSVEVQFQNICLSYEESSSQLAILQDVSFSVSPGEKVALIGSSGAGKTSVMKLLLRYMDPTSGHISVNGCRLADVQLSSWMEHVGYIPQQAQVFDGTIRYNLTFGLSEERQKLITDEEIWEVMRLLQIDFGDRLTDGLDTLVGKDGMKLSGGQAQRLMIGAAVIKKPAFMVIDEATSSLDSSTERLVQQGLEKVLAGPTGALIVAHRLSTVRQICNRFIVLRPLEEVPAGESQIEAQAYSFEELYEVSPTFRRLADDQYVVI